MNNKNLSDVFFDKKSHTYKSKTGVKIPGVTKILQESGLVNFYGVNPDSLAQAAAFGTEVHEAAHLFDLTGEPPKKTSSDCAECLCVYVDFLREFDVKILESEKIVYSKKFGYAGTLDRVAVFKKISDKSVIFDIKTGAPSISHGVQLSAYERAFNTTRTQLNTYTLYINKNGFKLVENFELRKKFSVFLSALQIHNYKNSC